MGQKVMSGDVSVSDAVQEASKAAIVAITPTTVSKYCKLLFYIFVFLCMHHAMCIFVCNL